MSQRLLLLPSTGSRPLGLVVVVHGLSRFASHGIWIRDQTGIPCAARRILNQGTAREAPNLVLIIQQINQHIY